MEHADTPSSETPNAEFLITNRGSVMEISSPLIDLTSEGDPLRFSVTLEKVLTPISQNTVIENITLDTKSLKVQGMITQARALRDIPEREKPRRILQILRSNIHYAYNDVLEDIAKTDPELAKWVAENTGVRSSSTRPLTFSEIVDKGYGVCRHLSAGMLLLAKEAGMEGAYLTYSGPIFDKPDPKYMIKNVSRRDNGQPLFRGDEIGKPVWEGHAWVELRTSSGEWIPVDPSTQLVGDTPEGLETFRDANYIAMPSMSLEIDGFPSNVGILGNQDLWLLSGEKTHTGVLEVNSKPQQKPIKIGKQIEEAEDSGPWPKSTAYKGLLNFSISSHVARDGMNVRVVEVKALK